MRACTIVEAAFVAALFGCSGSQKPVGTSLGESASESPTNAEAAPSAAATAPVATAEDAKAKAKKSNEPEPPPPPDPALVTALVAKTGEAANSDNPLHLRLEVTPRPAGELWLVAAVNRGTEPTSVLFDMRRLTLTLTNAEDPAKPRPKWKKKPAPTVCKLPEGFGGNFAIEEEPRSLAPGEGLVQTFDPRLYCISASGDSQLATGQTVSVKLGFSPKPPRSAWQHGKRVDVAAVQVAPFVAQPADLSATKIDPEHDLRVKELVANDFSLSAEMTHNEAEADPTLPLQLRLLHGSDAGTELNATAVMEVRARKKTPLYFRRELVSFIVHGPDGIRGCDPQPDDRAPDRQAYSTLAAGQAISVTSLLTELCPKYTFGRPGLYLVSASMDADRDGSEFGLAAFTGHLESQHEALVRIRTGDLPPLATPEPLLVKVGQ